MLICSAILVIWRRGSRLRVDSAFPARRIRFFDFPRSLFDHFLGGNAVARSPLSQARKDQHDPFGPAEKVTVGDEGWTVANQQDNTAVSASASFASEAQAQDFLAAHQAANPGAAAHVIPAFEVAA